MFLNLSQFKRQLEVTLINRFEVVACHFFASLMEDNSQTIENLYLRVSASEVDHLLGLQMLASRWLSEYRFLQLFCFHQ